MLSRFRWLAIPVVGGLIAAAGLGLAAVPRAVAKAEAARELTVYNQDFAVVTQETAVTLVPGANQIEWSDLPHEADGTSFQVDWGQNAGKVRVWEQNYSQGLSGQYELLMASIGHQIILGLEGGAELRGLLRTAESGQILVETEDGLVSVNQGKVIAIRSLEPNLRPAMAPFLSAKVFSDFSKEATLPAKLNYTTRGIDWQGDYRLEYDQGSGQARVDVWATVTNRSNFDYGDIKLRLVAGKVNTDRQVIPLGYGRAEMKAAAVPEYALNDSAAARSEFSIYHLYTIREVTSLRPHQTKQIRLSEAGSVPMEEKYIYDAQINPREIAAKLVFVNDKESGLGLPLPAGRVRVFTTDNAKSLRFAGEDRLDNLPEGAEAEISMGSAFGLTAERTQTELVRPTKDSRQESYSINLRNSSAETVTVIVREHLNAGADWEITNRSHKYSKVSATEVEFPITIPAGDVITLEYTVRYLYQA